MDTDGPEGELGAPALGLPLLELCPLLALELPLLELWLPDDELLELDELELWELLELLELLDGLLWLLDELEELLELLDGDGMLGGVGMLGVWGVVGLLALGQPLRTTAQAERASDSRITLSGSFLPVRNVIGPAQPLCFDRHPITYTRTE